MSRVKEWEFVQEGGLHVGFTETVESERRKGYSSLIKSVINYDFRDRDLYLVVWDKNLASLKNVGKSGYLPYAKGYLEDGFWRISEWL